MTLAAACVVMAFDGGMFEQAKVCVRSLQKQTASLPWRVHVFDIGLTDAQATWLAAEGATISKDLNALPLPSGAPGYFRAQACRPLLRELIPGHSLYLWVDADLRLLDPNALNVYLRMADQARQSIAISQEADPAYCFVNDPAMSQMYHQKKRQRLVEVYGESIGAPLGEFLSYNSGLFAMHRDSPIWDLYRKNVDLALRTSFNHMKEQDAMNAAIFENGVKVAGLHPIFNWLCSASEPARDTVTKKWVRPVQPYLPISVLHLSDSNCSIQMEGGGAMRRLDYYRLKEML